VADCSTPVYEKTGLTSTEHLPAASFDAGTTYYICLMAVDGTGTAMIAGNNGFPFSVAP
jgi:hypothetical protein